jgi:RNA 2',3'-cyclic 3'-phosphodiesterase
MTAAAIRAFIAIELPHELHKQLGLIIDRLQEQSPRSVRWVTARNIHLTLKFLGNVSPDNLPQLTGVIQNEARRCEPFEIRATGLGAFPNRNHPRVIWVGILAPPGLLDLQRGIDRETERLGYQNEEHGFSPHLTLGRVSQHATPQEVKQITDVLAKTTIGDLGTLQVASLHLFQSDLQPSGAVYSPLFRAVLGN